MDDVDWVDLSDEKLMAYKAELRQLINKYGGKKCQMVVPPHAVEWVKKWCKIFDIETEE